MDVHKLRPFERLEIVATGRRRRWSDDEKLRIVMESQSAPRMVSMTARRHGISRSQLGTWLRSFRAERLSSHPASAFVPVLVGPEPVPEPVAVTDETAIVVELPTGGRLRMSASTPPALAAAVLKALR
ncbi:hypothetical protein GCM10011390_49760 [Aureimonas endophytica]|uniref:Transposase n=1 Tax=Aureimonas endophytica TaxID=2027858 RepID=A0A917A395_9HYPH|nr:transposase [Aureimonas endophytica]GGE24385.1 hypothetical protein GCM10011390_49760 [Aureimonas endophytica]